MAVRYVEVKSLASLQDQEVVTQKKKIFFDHVGGKSFKFQSPCSKSILKPFDKHWGNAGQPDSKPSRLHIIKRAVFTYTHNDPKPAQAMPKSPEIETLITEIRQLQNQVQEPKIASSSRSPADRAVVVVQLGKWAWQVFFWGRSPPIRDLSLSVDKITRLAHLNRILLSGPPRKQPCKSTPFGLSKTSRENPDTPASWHRIFFPEHGSYCCKNRLFWVFLGEASSDGWFPCSPDSRFVRRHCAMHWQCNSIKLVKAYINSFFSSFSLPKKCPLPSVEANLALI